MEKTDLQDDFLKNLLKNSGRDKPGIDFTATLMKDIYQLEAEKARNPWWSWSTVLWALLVIAALALFYFALFPFLNISIFNLTQQNANPERFQRYLDLILDSFNGFLFLIDFLKESTLFLVVVFVTPVLMLLDRLFKRFTSRLFLFVF
ncbi:MAG: hypothetical protein U1C46_10880 [Bacteroidales bacterium]|nr:hypothetical protein [Bacteroidales bacterium]MDZ4205305.1 hypothetical protein [Bacteroidales bacterium]